MGCSTKPQNPPKTHLCWLQQFRVDSPEWAVRSCMVSKLTMTVPASPSNNLVCQYSSTHTIPVTSAGTAGFCSALLIISESRQEFMLQLPSCAAIRSQLSPLLAICLKPHRINYFVTQGLLEEISRWIYQGGMCRRSVQEYCPLQCSLNASVYRGSYALSPPHNTSADASSPQEILQKPLREKKRAACVLFLLLLILSSFLPAPKVQQISPFLQ